MIPNDKRPPIPRKRLLDGLVALSSLDHRNPKGNKEKLKSRLEPVYL